MAVRHARGGYAVVARRAAPSHTSMIKMNLRPARNHVAFFAVVRGLKVILRLSGRVHTVVAIKAAARHRPVVKPDHRPERGDVTIFANLRG